MPQGGFTPPEDVYTGSPPRAQPLVGRWRKSVLWRQNESRRKYHCLGRDGDGVGRAALPGDEERRRRERSPRPTGWRSVFLEMDWERLLSGRRELELGDGWSLRLLSAMEVLEARREAKELVREDRERALCSNACLLARALFKDSEAWFESGAAALNGLSVEEIGALGRRWAEFNRAENPSAEDGEERVETLKKALSTRRMPGFSGACSRLLARFRRRNARGR